MSPEERSTRRDVLALLAVLGVTTETLAQDAIAADPRSFRVLIDNERVRVLEYRSGPGLGVCGQGMHDHPDRVTVALTPAKVRVVNAQGQTLVHDIPPGHVFFAPAETHSVENIGGADTRVLMIELKGGGWRPSTG